MIVNHDSCKMGQSFDQSGLIVFLAIVIKRIITVVNQWFVMGTVLPKPKCQFLTKLL